MATEVFTIKLTTENTVPARDAYSCDEAVELTGHGKYNYLCLVTCCVVTIAVGMDMFGFSIIVTAAKCDLGLGITETGILASAPFVGELHFPIILIIKSLLFAYPWGYFADAHGRRLALLISTSVGFVLSALSSLSPMWQVMLVLKLLGCAFSSAAFTLTMTYLGECTQNKHRSRYLFIMNSINVGSELFCYLLAYLILAMTFKLPLPLLSISFRPWRFLNIAMAMPLGIGAAIMYYMYESPKFLANKGKFNEALDVLNGMYRINGGYPGQYPVRFLDSSSSDEDSKSKNIFYELIVKQAKSIFELPQLWRTLQLFYLIIICCSTNNAFVMWYPKMVNSFFISMPKGSNGHESFCQRIIRNMTETHLERTTCDDTISDSAIFSGMVYGLYFMVLSFAVLKFAARRKMLIVVIFCASATSGILVEAVVQPVVNIISFTTLQVSALGIGVVASYFVDLYPTSCRGLVTSLAMMVGRMASLAGVNLVGAVIVNYCSLTFYAWSLFVISGVIVTLVLPSEQEIEKKLQS